jgi:hypothetical protein
MPIPWEQAERNPDVIIPNMRDVEVADLESLGTILPEGKYLCSVISVEPSEDGAQKPFLKFEFQVVGPADYAGKKLWDRVYLTNAALPISKAKLAAINFDTSSDRAFNAADFVGRGVMLTVAHRQGMNRDNLPRTFMDVSVWAKVGEGSTPPPAPVAIEPDDDIPF